jgi:hypothetical protein
LRIAQAGEDGRTLSRVNVPRDSPAARGVAVSGHDDSGSRPFTHCKDRVPKAEGPEED